MPLNLRAPHGDTHRWSFESGGRLRSPPEQKLPTPGQWGFDSRNTRPSKAPDPRALLSGSRFWRRADRDLSARPSGVAPPRTSQFGSRRLHSISRRERTASISIPRATRSPRPDAASRQSRLQLGDRYRARQRRCSLDRRLLARLSRGGRRGCSWSVVSFRLGRATRAKSRLLRLSAEGFCVRMNTIGRWVGQILKSPVRRRSVRFEMRAGGGTGCRFRFAHV